MILTIIVFILILGLLIFVHELGHFVVAKRNGVRVDEFGFGFPPRLFGIKRGETVYSVNAVPLGGFVKIYGEDGEGVNSSRSYATKKPWQKAMILFSGVAMNFLLAVFLFSLGNFIGLPNALSESEIGSHPDARLQILAVAPGSPAGDAGILPGDFIVELKVASGKTSTKIVKPSDFQNFVDSEKNNAVIVVLERGGQRLELGVTPRPDPPAGQGPIGVELASVARVSLPWHQSIAGGFMAAISLIGLMFSALFQIIKNIFVPGQAGIDVVGPVGIFNLTGQAASLGFIYVLQLTAILSVNLAVINALPFPALDGGRALFLLIEKIKGSPLNEKFARTANAVGFAFLIALMVFITLRDVIKTF